MDLEDIGVINKKSGSMTENKINIDIEALRKRSVFIATPMFGGQCSGFFMKSVLELTATLNNYGIKNMFFSIFNESLISRARNYVSEEFMRSGYTDLLFIDADIEFNPMDVLAMLQITEDDSDKSIIAGVYPKKNISFEKIKKAVDLGYADENPFVLENYSGDFVFNPVRNGQFKIHEPIEVQETGTGFLMIRRSVFELWNEKYPEYLYTPDHARSKHFDGSQKIMAYFQDPIMNDRHLSEDYFFCHQSRKIGLKIWICPWMNLNHIGTYKFVGNLAAVAATKSSPTADLEAVKGLKI